MTERRIIRILVVDDSETARRLVVRTLESQPDMKVIAQARDGEEAVALTRDLKPDVITMDVRMPTLDGLKATEQIMARFPTPIVIVSSSVEAADLQITFNALRVGALDVIEKPHVMDTPGFEAIRRTLVDRVRAMSEVSVVRRRSSPAANIPVEQPTRRGFHLVAIGASTGGPQLLGDIFSKLRANFESPIVVVQHMSPGFTVGFARWLGGESKLNVKIAEDGESLVPATIYIAPDEKHLRVTGRWRVALGDDPPVGQFRPSVDALFESVALHAASRTVGLLLTGMGSDGAKGLLALRRAGGLTIAQDTESCVVSGMPDSARELGAAERTLAPSMIPTVLGALVERGE